jgi:choline dehydrogenase-like flavoprotein
MLTDARHLDDGTVFETDVCIVGAGPAGITLALELAGSGLAVLVLESGGVSPRREDQWLAGGENADPLYYRLRRSRVIGFGGSSNHWMGTSGMRARPLEELDFVERPEIDRSGWPIARRELDGYYRRAQDICRLGDFDYHLGSAEEPDRPRLPLDPARVETVLFRCAGLGNFPGRLDEVVGAANVELLVHATALQLDTDAAGTRVETIRVAVGDGARVTVRPQTVVLAGGGIENARMLLLSQRQRPGALGPETDQVGRHLMEHPHVSTGVILTADAGLVDRLSLYGLEGEGEVKTFGMLTLPEQVTRDEALLGCAWSLRPIAPPLARETGQALAGIREAVTGFRRPIPGTAQRLGTVLRQPAEAVRALAAWRRPGDEPPVLALNAMSEQAPNPASRITLGSRRDKFGRPVARLDWRLTELDRRSIRRSQELVGDAFAEAGLGRLVQRFGEERPPAVLGGGFHHIGTTRMGTDPASSVVDPDGRVHGVDNCYVAGMSTFPTAGYANPTLTVVALAVRLAHHLRAGSEGSRSSPQRQS